IHAVVDRDLHDRPVVFEMDALDLADLDSGELDHGLVGQAGHVGEADRQAVGLVEGDVAQLEDHPRHQDEPRHDERANPRFVVHSWIPTFIWMGPVLSPSTNWWT